MIPTTWNECSRDGSLLGGPLFGGLVQGDDTYVSPFGECNQSAVSWNETEETPPPIAEITRTSGTTWVEGNR